jgi:hypothetical protein
MHLQPHRDGLLQGAQPHRCTARAIAHRCARSHWRSFPAAHHTPSFPLSRSRSQAVYKAKQCKLFDFDTFDLREYIYYEQVENGDLNWILPNMCAFAGPQETREAGLLDGYSTLVPEDYLEYFKQRNVRCIMRLNKKYYNAERFEKHGIHVVDLHYRDGSVPPMSLLQTVSASGHATKQRSGST